MNENTMLVPQMGINMEQAAANCEELAKAIREITAGVLTTVNSFCRWIQRVAAEGLARATTFSNVEALYFVADQAASGKREVNGHA